MLNCLFAKFSQVSKKKLVAFLLLAGMIFFSISFLCRYIISGGAASSVNIVIQADDSTYNNIFRLSGGKHILELKKKKGSEWHEDHAYCRKILLLTSDVNHIRRLDLVIQGKETHFNSKTLKKYWVKNEKGYYESPAYLEKQTLVLIPFINWQLRIHDFLIKYGLAFILSVALLLFAWTPLLFLKQKNDGKQEERHLFFVFFFSLVIVGLFALIMIDPHHDGIIFKPSWDVVHGATLYKESFAQYGILSSLLQAAALKIFGAHLIVLRLLTALFYAGIACLLWTIWSRLLPYALADFVSVIWILLSHFLFNSWWMPYQAWSTIFMVFFVILAEYFLIRFIEVNSRRVLLLYSGICSGLAFGFKQNALLLNIFIILFLVFYSWANKHSIKVFFKNVVYYALGVFIIGALIALWLWMQESYYDWFLQNIVFAKNFAAGFYTLSDHTSHNLILRLFEKLFQIHSEHGGKSFLWTLFPLVMLVVMGKKIFKKEFTRQEDQVVFSIIAISLFCWSLYYPVNAVFHMHTASGLMIGLCVYFFWDLLKFQTNKTRALCILFIIYIIFSSEVCIVRLPQAFDRLMGEYGIIQEPVVLKGMFVPEKEKAIYARMSAILKDYFVKNPSGNVITLGNDALYLTFHPRIKSYQPMYVDWNSSVIYPDVYRVREAYISRNKPLVISPYGMIDHYFPVASFSPQGVFVKPVLFLEPGVEKNNFEILRYYHQQSTGVIELTPKKSGVINSVFVSYFSYDLLPKWLDEETFKVNVLNYMNRDTDRNVISHAYTKKKVINGSIYVKNENISQDLMFQLGKIFFSLPNDITSSFLGQWTTLEDFGIDAVTVFSGNKIIMGQDNRKDNMNWKVEKGELVVLKFSGAAISVRGVLKLRINYNHGLYSDYYFHG